ncbi:MAG: UbiD family decarboxylase [Deltaproteobacteria bacterium]|nr:UbiD family decarboxylase [Deltaproteobacteria bacterium]
MTQPKEVGGLGALFEQYRARGEVVEIAREVDSECELSGLIVALNNLPVTPPVFFPQVKGYRFPVGGNLFAERRRACDILGLPTDPIAFKEAYLHAMEHPVPPVMVPEAPCQERVLTGQFDALGTVPARGRLPRSAGRLAERGHGALHAPRRQPRRHEHPVRDPRGLPLPEGPGEGDPLRARPRHRRGPRGLHRRRDQDALRDRRAVAGRRPARRPEPRGPVSDPGPRGPGLRGVRPRGRDRAALRGGRGGPLARVPQVPEHPPGLPGHAHHRRDPPGAGHALRGGRRHQG